MQMLRWVVGGGIGWGCAACFLLLTLGRLSLPECTDHTPPFRISLEPEAPSPTLELTVHRYTVRRMQYTGLRLNPFRLCRGTTNILIVEVSITNHSDHWIYILDCFVRDLHGRSYPKGPWGNIPRKERLFVARYPPHQTRRGQLAFEIPAEASSWWLYCGESGSRNYAWVPIR